MKFLHIADLHLGQRHMQLQERYEDFFRTFEEILAHARREQVDFCIICGDMFDKKQLDAETLFRTSVLLRKMKEAGIPLFAIEGNHDQRLYEDRYSFLDYLAKEDLLILLRPTTVEGKERLEPWDEHTRTGSVYDFSKGGETVRIIGMGYITSSIQEEKITSITQFLEEHPHVRPTLLMMHGSIGGGIPGSVDKELLDPLRPNIDYVGLGHWHRRMEVDEWIYNPGSMEHTDINREDISKGYFLVDLTETKKTVTFFESGKRPIVNLRVNLKGAASLEEALLLIEQAALAEMETVPRETPLMCKCSLRGIVDFSPLELSKKLVESTITAHIPLLFLEFENLLTTKDMEMGEEHLTLASLSSEELAEEVIAHLLAKSSEFREEEQLAQKIQAVKKALLTKETPAHIISLLS